MVIRKDVYERNPWVALSMYKALCRAKEACYRSIMDTGSPKASFAWLQPMIEEEKRIIGEDWRTHSELYWLRYAAAYYRDRGYVTARVGQPELKVVNDSARNRLGTPVGYKLVPGGCLRTCSDNRCLSTFSYMKSAVGFSLPATSRPPTSAKP